MAKPSTGGHRKAAVQDVCKPGAIRTIIGTAHGHSIRLRQVTKPVDCEGPCRKTGIHTVASVQDASIDLNVQKGCCTNSACKLVVNKKMDQVVGDFLAKANKPAEAAQVRPGRQLGFGAGQYTGLSVMA